MSDTRLPTDEQLDTSRMEAGTPIPNPIASRPCDDMAPQQRGEDEDEDGIEDEDEDGIGEWQMTLGTDDEKGDGTGGPGMVMSEGGWSGTFSQCSKRMQGKIVFMLGQRAWSKRDFPGVDFSKVSFKDAIARKMMDFSIQAQRAKRIKTSTDLKELLLMPASKISKVVPADVRKKFQTSKPLSPEDLADFQLLPSSLEPLVITGRRDKKILVLRITIPQHFIQTLHDTKKLLPSHAEKSGRRGKYQSRNYCLWAKYSKHPYMSGDLIEDGDAAREWLSAQAPLMQYLSDMVKLWDFESYRNMTNHPWLDTLMVNKALSLGQKPTPGHPPPCTQIPLHKVAGIWYGMAVNMDQQSPGTPHRDSADLKHGFNCVIPYGTWQGADLLFWEVRKRVQVKEGEVIFFRSSALTHNVSPLDSGSSRNVVDFYSHQNMVDLERRKRAKPNKQVENEVGNSAELGNKRRRKL